MCVYMNSFLYGNGPQTYRIHRDPIMCICISVRVCIWEKVGVKDREEGKKKRCIIYLN